MEFSALLTLAVWTASITYLTSGKGELKTANDSLFFFNWRSKKNSFIEQKVCLILKVCILPNLKFI